MTPNKKFTSDIDLDFGDRDAVLKLIKHTPASIVKEDKSVKHNSGVYVTDIPVDPFTGYASLDYTVAEQRGYIKLDFLNVNVYNQIQNEAHLNQLLNTEPPWHRLYEEEFCKQLIHIGNHYSTLIAMPEAVNSIPRMAMFLAIIRPSKRHLIGQPWTTVAQTVWSPDANGVYGFKKSHSVAYATLVTLHMNLLNNATNQSN